MSLQPKSLGQVLYDEVIKHLQLLESDYFDLEYKNPEGFCVSMSYCARICLCECVCFISVSVFCVRVSV